MDLISSAELLFLAQHEHHCSFHISKPKFNSTAVHLTVFPQMRIMFILIHRDMVEQILLQEMKLSAMKTQSQLLEYIALSLYSSASLSSKPFMHQDGDKISTLETFLRSIILDLL